MSCCPALLHWCSLHLHERGLGEGVASGIWYFHTPAVDCPDPAFEDFGMKIVAMFLLLFSFSALAAPRVVDDAGVMQRAAFWLQGSPKFDEAFKCGDTAKFVSPMLSCEVACTTRYCTNRCAHSEDEHGAANGFYVENCTADSVSIYTDTGWSFDITRADYEAWNSTWFLSLLRSFPQFVQPEGIIKLQLAFPYGFRAAGGSSEIESVMIEGTHYPADGTPGNGFRVYIARSVGRSIPGVMQILGFQFGIGDDSYFFRLQEVPDALRDSVR